MDGQEENGTTSGAYEKRNLASYQGKELPTIGIKVFILNSYFDSIDEFEFTQSESLKVTNFIVHINTQGFSNLPGRNKKSNDPHTDDYQYVAKAQFAKEHQLFHYHIGVGEYDGDNHGDKTSEYVVHYSYNHVESHASIICVSPHPPFSLPTVDQLNSGVDEVFEEKS